MPATWFVRRRKRMLRHFRKLGVLARVPLSDQWGADFAGAVLTDAEPAFDALIEHLPDPGPSAPHLREFMVIAAAQLALFEAMRVRGRSARETWLVCRYVTERRLFGLPRLVRWFGRVLFFAGFVRRRMKRLAEASRRRPVGGNVFDYVDGDGETFDFGITYHRCATHQLMLEHGGAELAPFLCLGDIPCSDALGWGIQRTSTLAQGCASCDFRFKNGGPTKIEPVDWPPPNRSGESPVE